MATQQANPSPTAPITTLRAVVPLFIAGKAQSLSLIDACGVAKRMEDGADRAKAMLVEQRLALGALFLQVRALLKPDYRPRQNDRVENRLWIEWTSASNVHQKTWATAMRMAMEVADAHGQLDRTRLFAAMHAFDAQSFPSLEGFDERTISLRQIEVATGIRTVANLKKNHGSFSFHADATLPPGSPSGGDRRADGPAENFADAFSDEAIDRAMAEDHGDDDDTDFVGTDAASSPPAAGGRAGSIGSGGGSRGRQPPTPASRTAHHHQLTFEDYRRAQASAKGVLALIDARAITAEQAARFTAVCDEILRESGGTGGGAGAVGGWVRARGGNGQAAPARPIVSGLGTGAWA